MRVIFAICRRKESKFCRNFLTFSMLGRRVKILSVQAAFFNCGSRKRRAGRFLSADKLLYKFFFAQKNLFCQSKYGFITCRIFSAA